MAFPVLPLCYLLQAHTTATQSRDFQNFNHEVLMKLADILQQRGVKFA